MLSRSDARTVVCIVKITSMLSRLVADKRPEPRVKQLVAKDRSKFTKFTSVQDHTYSNVF